MVKVAIHVLLSVYAALCVYIIWNAQFNQYEWMLDDPQNKELTFCSLPLDDGFFLFFSPAVSLMFCLPLLALGAGWSARRRRPRFTMWLALAVLACWVVRFFVLAPVCPGRADF